MDYAKIRAHDPGGSIDDALLFLAAETEVVTLDESRVNVRTVADRYGMEAAEGIRQVLEVNYPAWVQTLYLDMGLDVCSPGTTDQLTKPPFDVDQIAQLLSFQTVERLVFPGIIYGDVEKARGQA